MTKRQKDGPGAAAQRDGDTFARLAKSAETAPPLGTPRPRGPGARRRTQKFADKKEVTPAALPGVPPGARTSSPAPAPIQGTPVKRVRLAEALRSSGLDELTVAQNYVVVVEKLRDGSGGADGTQKMLVDVLKECSRILEPPKSLGGGASDMPAVVNLYHNVPRPVREGLGEEPQPGEGSE
jgi:hypothetical protein